MTSARGAPSRLAPLCVPRVTQTLPPLIACTAQPFSGCLATWQKKSFMDKDSSTETMIDGLLGIMPVGCRNVAYMPASAVEALSKDDCALLHRSLPPRLPVDAAACFAGNEVVLGTDDITLARHLARSHQRHHQGARRAGLLARPLPR